MKQNREEIVVVLRSPQSVGEDDTLAKNRETIEAALGLANQRPAHVQAIGVFTSNQNSEICQEAIELGCDAALSIRVPVPFDFFGEALLLKAAIAKTAVSVVLCPDFDKSYQGTEVGSALGFMLDMPAITGVSDCRFKGDDFLLSRRSESGVDQFCCEGPLLLALVGETSLAAKQRTQAATPGKVKAMSANDLLDDLAVLYARSPLAVHAAAQPRSEAAELYSDPKALLRALQTARLWTAK